VTRNRCFATLGVNVTSKKKAGRFLARPLWWRGIRSVMPDYAVADPQVCYSGRQHSVVVVDPCGSTDAFFRIVFRLVFATGVPGSIGIVSHPLVIRMSNDPSSFVSKVKRKSLFRSLRTMCDKKSLTAMRSQAPWQLNSVRFAMVFYGVVVVDVVVVVGASSSRVKLIGFTNSVPAPVVRAVH